MSLVYGIGINDADYPVVCPFYSTWKGMLQRCYAPAPQHTTYSQTAVCPQWLVFSRFKGWMQEQNWEGNCLDKDLVGDGTLYSPETCCFVPSWLNNLLLKPRTSRDLPTGVYERNGRFHAQTKRDGKKKFIGSFDTATEAAAAYRDEKLSYVRSKMLDYPDERVRFAVLEKVKCL